MYKAILDSAEAKMKKTVEIFGRELAGMRAGRAHPALLEKVQVEYYGTPTPLQHLATITAPEPRSLVVQPFDRGAVGTIEKALLKADLGVSVRVDGAVLRVTVPPLTEERRKDLVRQLKRRAEEEKVAVRNIRREALEELRAAEKEHQISEDELRRAESEMQKLTDRYTKEIDQLAEAREQDILTP